MIWIVIVANVYYIFPFSNNNTNEMRDRIQNRTHAWPWFSFSIFLFFYLFPFFMLSINSQKLRNGSEKEMNWKDACCLIKLSSHTARVAFTTYKTYGKTCNEWTFSIISSSVLCSSGVSDKLSSKKYGRNPTNFSIDTISLLAKVYLSDFFNK